MINSEPKTWTGSPRFDSQFEDLFSLLEHTHRLWISMVQSLWAWSTANSDKFSSSPSILPAAESTVPQD